jgi:hypothetical protein
MSDTLTDGIVEWRRLLSRLSGADWTWFYDTLRSYEKSGVDSCIDSDLAGPIQAACTSLPALVAMVERAEADLATATARADALEVALGEMRASLLNLALLVAAPPVCEEHMPDDQPVPAPSSLGSPERSRTGRDGSGQAGRLPPRLALPRLALGTASSADCPQAHAWHPISYWRWPLWKCQRCKMQTKHLAAAAAIACQPTRLGYCRVCQVRAMTPTSLYCRLHRAESGKQRRKQRVVSDAEMVALRDLGVTFKSIAERLEVSIPRARQLVREARAGLAGGQP